jgi:hypothetical protein
MDGWIDKYKTFQDKCFRKKKKLKVQMPMVISREFIKRCHSQRLTKALESCTCLGKFIRRCHNRADNGRLSLTMAG